MCISICNILTLPLPKRKGHADRIESVPGQESVAGRMDLCPHCGVRVVELRQLQVGELHLVAAKDAKVTVGC